MRAAVFTLRLASGETVATSVHGSGGPIAVDTDRRMRLAVRRAGEGRRLVGVYEPQPGHVRAYRVTMEENVDQRVIDLRGATLVSVE